MNAPVRLQRAPMLQQLREHLLTPDAGGVCVQGPVGIGKTSLLFELYGRLRAEPELLVGACRFESLEDPPFFPVLGAIGEAMGGWLRRTRTTAEHLAECLPPTLVPPARALIRYCLALGSPSGTGEPGSRWRLREVAEAQLLLERLYFEQRTVFDDLVVRLMLSVVHEARTKKQSGRFVLIYDQVECAGRFSRGLLELLLTLPPSVCTVVLSYNEAVDMPSLVLPNGMRSLRPFELGALSQEDGAELYKHLGGQDPLRATAPALQVETGGNPLSMRFLVLAERFEQPFDSSSPLAACHMQPLLSVLSGPARDLLGLMALLPVSLHLGRVDWAELVKVEPSTIEPLIQSLVQQGFLGMFPRTLVFSHARYRDIVLEDLSEHERLELGTRLARFVEIQYGRDLERACMLPVLSVFHAGLGLAGELGGWLKTAVELCDGWYALGEWEQAWHYCERLWEYAGSLEPREQARLFNVIGMVAFRLERWSDALFTFGQARELALGGGDLHLARLVELNIAGVALGQNDLDNARAAFRAVIEASGVEGDEETARQAWAQLAVCESRAAATVEALTAFLQAVKGAEQAREYGEAARLKQDLAELLLAHGQLEAGTTWLRQAMEDFRGLGIVEAEAHLMGRLAMALEHQGQIAQAEHCWLEALACVEGDDTLENAWCNLSNNYGGFLHRVGRRDDAVRVLQQALEVARSNGRTANEARILNNLAMLCESLGAPQLALEHARGSLRIKERLGDRRGVAVGRNNLGTLLFSLKQTDDALVELQLSLELWRGLEDVAGESVALNNLAMLYEQRGEFEKALRCYRNSLALKEMLQDAGAVRHTLTNMVLFLDEMRRFSKAEDCMKTLVSLDRVSNHPDLSREELYLAALTEKAREQPHTES